MIIYLHDENMNYSKVFIWIIFDDIIISSCSTRMLHENASKNHHVYFLKNIRWNTFNNNEKWIIHDSHSEIDMSDSFPIIGNNYIILNIYDEKKYS